MAVLFGVGINRADALKSRLSGGCGWNAFAECGCVTQLTGAKRWENRWNACFYPVQNRTNQTVDKI